VPDLEILERGEVADIADDARVGVVAGVGRVEAVGVGEQDQLLGAHEDGHLRREEVVVSE